MKGSGFINYTVMPTVTVKNVFVNKSCIQENCSESWFIQ